jgi:hypothetical protein
MPRVRLTVGDQVSCPTLGGETGAVQVERQRHRVQLADGLGTTVRAVAYAGATLRVERLTPETPLERWCAEHGVGEALSGGFATKPEYEPLGELWTAGRAQRYTPFRPPWDARRGAIAADDESVRIDHRPGLPPLPAADLLQAGPVLVRDGRNAVVGVEDPEGFAATADEFDQDLTAGREPRLAIAIARGRLLGVAADGRGPDDAGLTLSELADVLLELGAQDALNLDGGSAGVIVTGGRRVNIPRDDEGNVLEVSSPSVSAFVFS